MVQEEDFLRPDLGAGGREDWKWWLREKVNQLPGGGQSLEAGRVVPRKVWTGSYNLSKNAGHSLENAVLLTDKNCVSAYYVEWGQLAGLSEPLDWTSEYAQRT